MNLKEALHGLYVIEVAPTSRPSRGRWWQPERSGYTNEIAEAGLYDQAEAGETERRNQKTSSNLHFAASSRGPSQRALYHCHRESRELSSLDAGPRGPHP